MNVEIENATIFTGDGYECVVGLEPSCRSNQATRIAREESRERGLVYLLDSDGGWEVRDGKFRMIDDPDHWIYEGVDLEDE